MSSKNTDQLVERQKLKQALWKKYSASPESVLPRSLADDVSLSPSELYDLVADPWYHDFTGLGFPTPQRPGLFGPNQKDKNAPLSKLIDQALALCRKAGGNISGVELFCADGYFANYALQKGAKTMCGLDVRREDLSKAKLISKVLGNSEAVTFLRQDVHDLEGKYDFGICAGGLYHLKNPKMLLKKLTQHIKTALVIQTVYSLADADKDYFETPAPGWDWGCRFSYDYLINMVEDSGWKIELEDKNELTANPLPQDRGSAYLLCTPT